MGIYWQNISKQGFNPQTQQTTHTTRRGLYVDLALPMKGQYSEFVAGGGA